MLLLNSNYAGAPSFFAVHSEGFQYPAVGRIDGRGVE